MSIHFLCCARPELLARPKLCSSHRYCHTVQKRTFPKAFLALSRDVDTGSCHRASDALRRYKSGTGLTSGITSAAPGIILVIAALSLIHCQTFGGNDE